MYIYVAQPSPGRRRGGEAERRELQSVAGGSECAIWLGTTLDFPSENLSGLGLARHQYQDATRNGPIANCVSSLGKRRTQERERQVNGWRWGVYQECGRAVLPILGMTPPQRVYGAGAALLTMMPCRRLPGIPSDSFIGLLLAVGE